MLDVKCPKCGQRLRVPDAKASVGLRCPACKHSFSISPIPMQQTSPTAYDEGSIGTFPKAMLGTLGALGIALVVYLIYAGVRGPESPKPPAPVAVQAKDDKGQPPAALPLQAKDDKPKPPGPATKAASKPLAKKVPKPPPAPDLAGLGAPKPKAPPKPKPSSAPAALSPEDLFTKASPAVVRITVRDKDFKAIGLGSGFFISKDGLLVTNQHVIKDAHFASVRLSNGATFFVNGVVAVDAAADLALLKINGKDLPHLGIARDAIPKVGTKVFAIGNPKGLTNTFSQGMVSGYREPTKDLTIMQTTAAISPGSSGGPLLNARGEVVGVTTAYLMGGQNLNFAVPAAFIRGLIRNQGKLRPLASAGGKRLDKAATAELDKAWAAIDKKDWRTATTILTALRKKQKDNPFVWFALGYLHVQLGNHEIAVDMYNKAIAIKPDFAAAYCGIGEAYRCMKRYTDAIAACKKAIAIKPDLTAAYFHMGRAYSNLERYTDAIAAFKKAIALKPDYADAYFHMAQAYEEMKRYADAIAAYKQFLRLEPKGFSADRVRETISELLRK